MAHIRLDPWKVKVCLARKKMTRTELCKRTGISQANFSSMLKKGTVAPVTAGNIADALGVDVLEILVTPEEKDQ